MASDTGTNFIEEDFSAFETGMFSADVGPLTEYHYLHEAAPRHGWAVAAFGTREAGKAWFVENEADRKVMRQVYTNDKPYTHPMLSTGDFLWSDYVVTVTFRPQSELRCGLVFRYHNNRCYYFFGFDRDRVVLLRVRHETDFHVPDEQVLASRPCHREVGRAYTARVTVSGSTIEGEMDDIGRLSASDSTYPNGKVGLLADGPTVYYSVDVKAPREAADSFAVLRSRRDRELEELREGFPKPELWRKIGTPRFGTGRNLRFGDLDGDGRTDIAVAQVKPYGPRDSYSEVGCVTALSQEGEVLWQSGEPHPDEFVLTNDVGFQIHDLDGDGACEVVFSRNFEIIVADGKTGAIKNKTPTPRSKPPADRYDRILGDCIFFADTRGTGRAADLVIKDRYWHFWVYDDKLNFLWGGDCRTGHYPTAADIDNDGHDELAVGFSLYDHDGRLLWSLDDQINDHADGIAVVDFEQDGVAAPRILYTASDEGVLFVDLSGRILTHHRIGHAQNPVVAKLREDLPGLQTASINFWGNQGILHFFDKDGKLYQDAEPVNIGSMCLPANWSGLPPELFVHSTNPTYGGMFDGWGRPVVMFPDDGHPDMCNAVLDLTGDCRDEIVTWNQKEIWIYTQDDRERPDRLYRPVRNPLYNYSNYQASVSLPGWDTPKQ